jgi:TRAP-type C4-dicarboxylate transport system permease small subunit
MLRLDGWIYRFQVTIGTICALLVLIGVCWVVAQRYFLRSSLMGADELILLVAFWMYFMGASASARDRWHIRVNVVDNLPQGNWFRAACNFTVSLLNVGVTGAVTWLAVNNLLWNIGSGTQTPVFRIPTYWFDAAIVVALGLSFIYFLLDLILPVFGLDRPTEEEAQS